MFHEGLFVCRYQCDTQDLASQTGDKQSLELRQFAPNMIQNVRQIYKEVSYIYDNIMIIYACFMSELPSTSVNREFFTTKVAHLQLTNDETISKMAVSENWIRCQ